MSTTNSSQNLLSASLASASSLVLLQFISRIFTFALNQALVRLASPQVFGIAAIQFELLLSTILFLSREGVRNALLRTPSHSDRNIPKQLTENIALLPTYLGIPTAGLLAAVYVFTSDSEARPHFVLSVAVYVLAAALELLAEPLYVRAQSDLRFDVRVRAEGSAVFAKTLVTFLVLARGPPEWALFAFAAGQLAYGGATLVAFWHVYGGVGVYGLRRSVVELHGHSKNVYFEPELLKLAGAMTGQSVVKHFLTEGDKFLVSRLSPLADQGGYAIASNYGSLVARIIFQPIEETSRLYFSKTLLGNPSTSERSDTHAKTTDNPPPGRESLTAPARILMTLLLLFTHLFLLLTTFAPPYLPLATKLLLPPRYLSTSAPTILRAYIYYLPFMAYNGVLEAFFASACTPADLSAQARMMGGASLAFVGAAFALRSDAGLVYANIVNLGLRAGYAWFFVRRYFGARGHGLLARWQDAVPPTPVLAVFALAAAVTRWSAQAQEGKPLTIYSQTGHVAIGGACVAMCLLACFVFERRQFSETLAVLRRR
ncbi:Rft-1-domain-containing protein [Artomyces pyxidatus]|uniref:Rft-1-domain-containing protein n=1 Tax=Artomyces pyxidatus TaxID=48021 RepID=A0ACB8T6R0_9AGAM|nr:Rft-1-domain-containing protein [Artomyces pyxidatus]